MHACTAHQAGCGEKVNAALNENIERLAVDLIHLLADGEYHRLQDLNHALGLSANAELPTFEQLLTQLNAWGLEVVEQHSNYALSEQLDLLSYDRLCAECNDIKVLLFPVIGSTNQYLLDHSQQLQSDTLCVTEYQSAGRGRRGRNWLSVFGANLALSYYAKIAHQNDPPVGLNIAVALAVVDALAVFGIDDVQLKWPNDIYWQGKKLGGILIEMKPHRLGIDVVIGIGLNVRMSSQQQGNIDQQWVSLVDFCGDQLPSRTDLIIALVAQLKNQLKKFTKANQLDLEDCQRWREFDHFYGKSVQLIMEQQAVVGIVRGIDQQGALLLETQAGVTPYFYGDVSLRAFSDQK